MMQGDIKITVWYGDAMTLNTVHMDITTMLQGAATIWYGDVGLTLFSMHFVLLSLTLLSGLLKDTFILKSENILFHNVIQQKHLQQAPSG